MQFIHLMSRGAWMIYYSVNIYLPPVICNYLVQSFWPVGPFLTVFRTLNPDGDFLGLVHFVLSSPRFIWHYWLVGLIKKKRWEAVCYVKCSYDGSLLLDDSYHSYHHFHLPSGWTPLLLSTDVFITHQVAPDIVPHATQVCHSCLDVRGIRDFYWDFSQYHRWKDKY